MVNGICNAGINCLKNSVFRHGNRSEADIATGEPATKVWPMPNRRRFSKKWDPARHHGPSTAASPPHREKRSGTVKAPIARSLHALRSNKGSVYQSVATHPDGGKRTVGGQATRATCEKIMQIDPGYSFWIERSRSGIRIE